MHFSGLTVVTASVWKRDEIQATKVPRILSKPAFCRKSIPEHDSQR
ncbi:hypothetical protein Enr10x_22280 [Gimesia panareensis]|uniref:Uncharacterized protein n=1 Tax=Gimesia panareensis TaxID=2527978 RepID=A0A517Q5P0_9PLAN|nr:hypothetical protein Enr10x_22280 [Gimesia panareensis]